MTTRRTATLTGWGRYLCQTQDLLRQMDRVISLRKQGRYGVLVHDDDWALVYQRLNFRLHRAQRAFNPISCRTYSFIGDGPLTIELAPGIPIFGWVGKTEAEYAADNAKSFDDNYRQKAVKAKRTLVERYGEKLGGRLSGLLDKHDYEETLRESYG